MKIGRVHQQFRELEDDTSENLTGDVPTTTHTYITGGDAGRENLEIPHDAIEVQTNMDWQHTSRENFRSQC